LTEALVDNPKIEVTPDGKFIFKASYKIKDKKSLLRLLKQHDLKGLGGILLEDVQESLPHCDKALKVMILPEDQHRHLHYCENVRSHIHFPHTVML
jgi:hypothetical protein